VKTKELRSKTLEDLLKLKEETSMELFEVRMKYHSGQLLDVSQIGKLKKNVARILTVIKEKQ
jgi:large subunit ribosomal protein L29